MCTSVTMVTDHIWKFCDVYLMGEIALRKFLRKVDFFVYIY